MELKARTAQSIAQEEEMLELGAPDGIEPELVYLKSEADKVIAEKDAAIADLIEKNKRLAHKDLIMASETFKELRYQKFKRCLAMAKWCKCKRIDAADYRIPRKNWEFYDKWLKRWLKIAEQFKEGV